MIYNIGVQNKKDAFFSQQYIQEIEALKTRTTGQQDNQISIAQKKSKAKTKAKNAFTPVNLFKDCNILRSICAHPKMLQNREIGDEDNTFVAHDCENIDESQASQSQHSDPAVLAPNRK